jgi:hypothetical protein
VDCIAFTLELCGARVFGKLIPFFFFTSFLFIRFLRVGFSTRYEGGGGVEMVGRKEREGERIRNEGVGRWRLRETKYRERQKERAREKIVLMDMEIESQVVVEEKIHS